MRKARTACMLMSLLLSAMVPAHAALVINEVLADPHLDSLLGDANGDGIRDATGDEFVELVNDAASELNVAGWILSGSADTELARLPWLDKWIRRTEHSAHCCDQPA